MKKSFGLVFFWGLLYSFSFAQTKSKVLEIYSITEYIDGYVIKVIDAPSHDTLNIISVKNAIICKRNLQKMIVGQKYNFQFEDLIRQAEATTLSNLVARIKSTVVWSINDGIKNIPVYSKNTKGLWIDKSSVFKIH